MRTTVTTKAAKVLIFSKTNCCMAVKSKHPQTALFLGAGASAAFGYPITSGIFPLIREGLKAKNLFPVETNPKRERAKMERLKGYLETLMPSFFEPATNLPLITDILSLIDSLLRTNEVAIPMFSTKQMEDFRTLLEQAIIECIENKRPAAVRENKVLDRLTDWMLSARESSDQPLTIISTNYDTLFDALLFEKIEMEFWRLSKNAEKEQHLGSVVDMGFSWREHATGKFINAIHHPPASPWLRLFKLHGSMNWLKCPLCGYIYINTAGGIFQQAFREDKVDYNNTCVCGNGPVRTVIVAPSMVRSIQDPDLLTIWRSAFEQMRMADEWIIAGYSLPPEDIAIRSILIRAYHGRGKKSSVPKIRVVQRSKDETMEARYRLLFPDCSFEYGGFEQFATSLPKPARHYPAFP